MAWLDGVPGTDNLYIGGLWALRRRDAIKASGISHVVSVMRWPIEEDLIRPYKHLQIDVDDDEDENLLEYFPTTNRFIQDALDAGGSVLVHCAMGKSRSATVVIAYMMRAYRVDPEQALARLRESRGVCEPNPGFMAQLWVYHSMNTPTQVENEPMYQRWLYKRDLEASRAIRQAPETDKIRFEDEYSKEPLAAGFELKCRKCRRTLATSQYLVPHNPRQKPGDASSVTVPPSACAHYFIDALSWMRPELEHGKLEGRLECPKCSTNVGKYAWQGSQCSCGDWVVPGISLAKTRLDEVRSRPRGGGGADAVMGMRMPPGGGGGGAGGGGQGNL